MISSGLFFVYAFRGEIPLTVFPQSLVYRELFKDIRNLSDTWEDEWSGPVHDVDALEASKAYRLMGHSAFSEATNLRLWMPEGDFDEMHFQGWPYRSLGIMESIAAKQGFMPIWKEMARLWANDGI